MTIRLKLTLLYTIILALVVIVFSVLLYTFQSQTTLNIVERRLVTDYYRVTYIGRPRPDRQPPPFPAELVPNNFRPGLIQIRNLDETLMYQSDNLAGTVLPLSADGYQAVTQGQVWLERVQLDDEWFLIRSQLDETDEAETLIVQTALPVGNEIEYLRELKRILVAGDLVVIVLAFGLGWTFAGWTLRPIDRITQTAQMVGEERDFSRRVGHTGPDDEIGRLAKTFNAMLARLQEAYVQVEQSLQAQRRFVADASHELRTPLTTIRGNMELLQHQPALEAEERTDILTDTIDETNRLMRLVNDLLVLARADTQQTLPLKPVYVQPLLDDVCRQAQQLDTEHTIVCESGVDGSIMGNRDAIRQILLILLDNAIKHTPPQSEVIVSSEVNDDHIAIHVQDNGPGIDAELLPHIFERFYRGDVVRTGPGTGLGLSIARELTEAQGGTIAVESTMGEGSLFTLSFPNQRPEMETDTNARVRTKKALHVM
ncbi:HAMP domain-containing histidine kinase [Chloroflexi bacterium TSY]|nr:HAMP domain-containing histidine kinase [Chloroflexi bacterium TSY]